MTPLYLNSPPSPFHLIELKEDQQQQQQMQFFSSTGPPQHQPSSSLSSPIFFNITQDQRASDHSIEPQKENEYIMLGASNDHRVVLPASSSIHGTVESSARDNNGLSICKVEDEVEDKRDYESTKWMMSKKIRIVQKMMSTGSHEKQERIIKIKFPDLAKDKCEINSPSNCGNVVRICSDCKTSKTPLWRSGPQGPKSLCNACGIRQRKARRAMLAAAAAANGTVDVTTEDNSKTKTKVQKKEKKSSSSYHMTQFKIAAVAAANGTADVTTEDNSKTKTKVQKKEKKSRSSYHMTQFKKAFGTPQGDRERISFEDFALSLSKSLAFRRVFPKDEEEAAILLMALSCGLLHS